MSTFVIVGAGRGLGAAAARRFAREGFAVALIARDASRVEGLATDLNEELGGGPAPAVRGYAADVRDAASLTAALASAAQELGPIEVLQYSPAPAGEFMRPVLETAPADLLGPVEMSVHGAVTAVQQVLPGMRLLGRGTILFVNGGSAVRPRAAVAGTSIAMAGASALVQMLHDELAEQGVHVAQLIIPGAITVDDGANDPDAIAGQLWQLHARRDGFRHFTRELP